MSEADWPLKHVFPGHNFGRPGTVIDLISHLMGRGIKVLRDAKEFHFDARRRAGYSRIVPDG